MELKLFSPLLSFEHEMQSMFDRMLGRPVEMMLRPAIDILRRDDRLVVDVELPGVDPEKDVEIAIEGDMLVIRGSKSEERESRENGYLLERTFGSFERHIPLPEGADVDAVEAVYERGVLSVTVPVTEVPTETSRKIPVTVG